MFTRGIVRASRKHKETGSSAWTAGLFRRKLDSASRVSVEARFQTARDLAVLDCARIAAKGSSSARWACAVRRSPRDPGRAVWRRGQRRLPRAEASFDGQGQLRAAPLHRSVGRRDVVDASRPAGADDGPAVARLHRPRRRRATFPPLAETGRPDLVRADRAGTSQLARVFRTRTRVRRPSQGLSHCRGGLSGAAYQAGATLARRSP